MTILQDVLEQTGNVIDSKKSRNAYVTAVLRKAQALNDEKWEALTEESKEWVNDNTRRVNANKHSETQLLMIDPETGVEVVEVDIVGQDEQPAPRKRERAVMDTDKLDKETTPDKPSEEEASIEENSCVGDDSVVEEPVGPSGEKKAGRKKSPATKRSTCKPVKTPIQSEAPVQKTGTLRPSLQNSVPDISTRVMIKQFLIEDPTLSVSDIEEILKQENRKSSSVTINMIRYDTLQTLTLLQDAGKLA